MNADSAVSITKISPQGQPVATYHGRLVALDDQQAVARCPWSLPRVLDLGGLLLEPGDIFTEYYYSERWFNVFRIEDGTGRLKGWYCNVTRPPDIVPTPGDCHIRWQDLALDLLVLPDGRNRLLDQDEFEALDPSAEVRARADEALRVLIDWLAHGTGPFEELRTPRPSRYSQPPADVDLTDQGS